MIGAVDQSLQGQVWAGHCSLGGFYGYADILGFVQALIFGISRKQRPHEGLHKKSLWFYEGYHEKSVF